jgi:hypothetical protein
LRHSIIHERANLCLIHFETPSLLGVRVASSRQFR